MWLAAGVCLLVGLIWLIQWAQEKLYSRRALRLYEKRDRSEKDWWEWYNFYLTTAEWHMRRQGVLLRGGGRCEKCGQFLPVQAGSE